MLRVMRCVSLLLVFILFLVASRTVQAQHTDGGGAVDHDGVKIHYEVEDEGPPLVMMHWWTGSLNDWRMFGYVDKLRDSYQLILIDARGHGQSDKSHDSAAYDLETQAGDVVAVLDELGILPIQGQALANAAPDTAQGPYPLVTFSPGLAGWSQPNSYLLEHLASYGFVAVAYDPRGETFTEFWEGAATRPLDTRAAIDYADKLTALDGDLGGLIDMEHIASIGHSSGGWAALVGGGAQMDLGWCAANPDLVAQTALSNCTQFVPNADKIATMLGLESTPEGIWPPMNDLRVDAVVALAADGDIWGAEYEGVSALKVPALVMGGSNDTVNIPERTAYPIYGHLGSAQKSRIIFAGGDHMIFFNQCRDTPWMVPDSFWACSDAVWDMDRVHDLINHSVTAFLLSELKGDPAATDALALENMVFPGVQYETTEFGAGH